MQYKADLISFQIVDHAIRWTINKKQYIRDSNLSAWWMKWNNSVNSIITKIGGKLKRNVLNQLSIVGLSSTLFVTISMFWLQGRVHQVNLVGNPHCSRGVSKFMGGHLFVASVDTDMVGCFIVW